MCIRIYIFNLEKKKNNNNSNKNTKIAKETKEEKIRPLENRLKK